MWFLPLHYLFHLKRLNIANNNLYSLEYLDKCLNLEVIFLENNNISDIGKLKSLTELKILDLGNNPLDNINELDELKHIEYIFLPYYCKSNNLERKLKNSISENIDGRIITNYKIYFNKYYISSIGFQIKRITYNF